MQFIKEQEWDGGRYDWHWITPYGNLDSLVVPAKELIRNPDADVVAVWLDVYRKPIYLVGRDGELYHHHGFDEILEQHFPAQDYLRWRNSWEYPALPFTATEPFPEGWNYMRCYPKTFILIREDLWEDFSAVVAAHAYKYSYHISCDYPILVEETLKRINNQIEQ